MALLGWASARHAERSPSSGTPGGTGPGRRAAPEPGGVSGGRKGKPWVLPSMEAGTGAAMEAAHRPQVTTVSNPLPHIGQPAMDGRANQPLRLRNLPYGDWPTLGFGVHSLPRSQHCY